MKNGTLSTMNVVETSRNYQKNIRKETAETNQDGITKSTSGRSHGKVKEQNNQNNNFTRRTSQDGVELELNVVETMRRIPVNSSRSLLSSAQTRCSLSATLRA